MADSTYTPLFARVLIRREVKEKSAGGIIIPNAQRHAKHEGVVVAKGETASESITVGDRVIFGKHAGAWLDSTYSDIKDTARGGIKVGEKENDDGTLFICQDEDLLCIIK